jgi:hypothetical protein
LKKSLKKHQAIPLPLGRTSSRESGTFKSGIAGEHRINPPLPVYKKSEAPSPEDQQKSTLDTTTQTIPQSRPDLQMSPENCRKVHNYSAMFGVPDPQVKKSFKYVQTFIIKAWVRRNCAFVQTFVKAPCEDINTFVDSCYRVRFH